MESYSIQRKGTRDQLTFYLAGHTVPAGTYRQVGTQREIHLEEEDILPATCDGHVAVYERLTETWAELQDRKT